MQAHKIPFPFTHTHTHTQNWTSNRLSKSKAQPSWNFKVKHDKEIRQIEGVQRMCQSINSDAYVWVCGSVEEQIWSIWQKRKWQKKEFTRVRWSQTIAPRGRWLRLPKIAAKFLKYQIEWLRIKKKVLPTIQSFARTQQRNFKNMKKKKWI